MNKVKVLYFDIETSPMLVWTHYIGSKVSINPVQIEEYKKVICIGYQWSDSNKTECLEWDTETQDDSSMLAEFNKIAGTADVLVGHNGQNFDVKEIRGHIAMRGLADAWCETPVLDTLKDFRASFRLPSNRLDAIAQQLGMEGKNPMSFQDWIDVVKGCPKAFKKMVKYCKKDVKVLKDVHQRLDSYVKLGAQSVNLRTARYSTTIPTCPECGSGTSIKHGFYRYRGETRQRFLCKTCYKVHYAD